MSAYEVTEKLVDAINSKKYDCIILNYANPDMVGHTGNLEAAIKAIEAIDECVGKVVEAVEAQNGVLIITADHGNSEQMIDYSTGEPHTAHTTNPVPLILVGMENAKLKTRKTCRPSTNNAFNYEFTKTRRNDRRKFNYRVGE